jgi:uncharacterized heparinase superfamily protein
VKAGLGRYWHTIRHLRPVQIYGRARLRLAKSRIDPRPAPRPREVRADIWVRPARRRPSMLGPDTLRFLNETGDVADRGWDDPTVEKLWRYNLHYFDDLNAIDSHLRSDWHRALMREWVDRNPPGTGTGWDPYPTSIRIVNWIKWSLAGNELPPQCGQSLATQARWLTRRLEFHLLGNHLLANAKALVFAGSFFEGPEADAWRETGLRLLDRELPEQILADGGHFERSTMYHALALEDVLDLCNIAVTIGDGLPDLLERSSTWRTRVESMRSWLATMSHPDGEVSFFNDAAVGIAPSPHEIDDYAVRLGFGPATRLVVGLTHLFQSGYVRIARDQCAVIIDVAPVGPDYLPAHAHADTLSFELSLFGHRVLVNSGTSLYRSGRERERQRGTPAHNTVVIDGENSSEVWDSFRVARRAHPTDLSTVPGDPIIIQCSHDGYARLRGSPRHTRRWTLTHNTLDIEDRISGRFHTAQARFHLHPAVQVEAQPANDNRGVVASLKLPQGQTVSLTFEGGRLKKESSTWHPEFGRSVGNTCLVQEFSGAVAHTRITWTPTP